MNENSLTALIFTFHDLSFITMLIIALLLSFLSYMLVIRRLTKHKKFALLCCLVIFLLVGQTLSEKLFSHKAIGIELIRA